MPGISVKKHLYLLACKMLLNSFKFNDENYSGMALILL